MFEAKKNSLFEINKSKQAKSNSFIEKGLEKSAETLSGNMAKKYSTTGNTLVDQFGLTGAYKEPRQFTDIAKDCESAWAFDKRYAVLFIFYLRTIVRVVKLFNGASTETSQKGAQLKHEAIMRMIWLYHKEKQIFLRNIGLFISLGSWKDINTMLQYDLVYHGWDNRVLDWEFLGKLILTGLENRNTSELVKKYLPQLRSNNKCTTVEAQADNMIAKWICSLLYGNKESTTNYKKYRQLKASGTAHQWQQLISRQQFDRIDFDKIHGRALNLLVKSKFLANQNLTDKYKTYVSNPEKETIKYTGFVHEVMDICARQNSLHQVPDYEQETANKQFAELIKKGGASGQTDFIVVRDTSGSMSSPCPGTAMSCYNVAKSIALYFSYFLHGRFEDAWIEFNNDAKMHKWTGKTPCEKWFNDKSSFVGSTNFQSVIDLFVKIKNQGVPEDEFPTGILCISDGEFNPSGQLDETNVTVAKEKLYKCFSKEYADNFVIILWNLQNSYYGRGNSGNKFETYGNTPNAYYFSGYEPSVISFLTARIKGAWELFEVAMNQEILNMIEI